MLEAASGLQGGGWEQGEVVRMVMEAGGVDKAVELAQAHTSTALDAFEGWEGGQVEELREFVGQVIGHVEARSALCSQKGLM